MLDAYIIEEIKRREAERRRQEEADRPRVHIEVDRGEDRPQAEPSNEEETDEAPIQIDMALSP